MPHLKAFSSEAAINKPLITLIWRHFVHTLKMKLFHWNFKCMFIKGLRISMFLLSLQHIYKGYCSQMGRGCGIVSILWGQNLTTIANHRAGFCRKIIVLSSFLLMMAPKLLMEKAREKMTEHRQKLSYYPDLLAFRLNAPWGQDI